MPTNQTIDFKGPLLIVQWIGHGLEEGEVQNLSGGAGHNSRSRSCTGVRLRCGWILHEKPIEQRI